ncbi:MAG TPA: hypothetical protein VGM60_21105 [Pseudonocardia sp.]|jgi:hypothetical protein|uniref:hypothetical protein n=1 Tax=Pseudonocardia sp. TaxID=60912 RepID=UPI002F3E8229
MVDNSHGLRYELAAAVARRAVLHRLARLDASARVVPLRVVGLALLPVTAELAEGFNPAALCALRPGGPAASGAATAGMLTGPESGFTVLTPHLLALFELGSHVGPIAYLEADYLGRDGWQSAAVWRGGRLVLGPLLLGRHEVFCPDTAPISVALRTLGVTAAGRRDEFVVAGLDRCRSTAQWAREQEQD